MNIYPVIRPFLMTMDAEAAHRLTLRMLKAGLGPRQSVEDSVLRVRLWGRSFPNPLGIAAGFDKNAEVIEPLFDMGFGFVEAGTVTPLEQDGNDRPRLFRDVQSRSVVNRLGFPGKGLASFSANIAGFRRKVAQAPGVLGANIGINKAVPHPFKDYKQGIETLAGLVDYIVINVSSPNTPGLRKLQEREELDFLLSGLVAVRDSCTIAGSGGGEDLPQLLLKVAPDLDAEQRAEIAQAAMQHKLDGLVVSNTTTTRPAGMAENLKNQPGGLSGQLLKDLALESLREFYRLTEGKLPLIGVGGIASAADAYERIRAGASLVQLYTGLVFDGPRLVPDILTGLAHLLKNDGFSSVQQAVGADSGLASHSSAAAAEAVAG